jgi:hypothetical protein
MSGSEQAAEQPTDCVTCGLSPDMYGEVSMLAIILFSIK